MSIFTDIFIRPPRRSKKVLDHPHITSTDFGKIIPILVEDVVPGDSFKCKTAAEIKLFPTLAPLKQGIEVRIDYFFVPNRLLWKDWQDFITGGEDGTEAPVKPFLEAQGQDTTIGSLWDYLSLPATIPNGARGNDGDLIPDSSVPVDAMPFRAYHLIFQEFYRDENLEEAGVIPLTGGLDRMQYDLRYRNLKKDYFTSALPWTQRGPQVTIPIGGEAPVEGTAYIPETAGEYVGRNGSYTKLNGDLPSTGGSVSVSSLGNMYLPNDDNVVLSHRHAVDIPAQEVDVTGTADLSEATGISINELRRLNSVQKWLERNARAGGRYVEQILSHFGVRTPDYRLDRPEYIGGGKQIIGMAEILQTSETGTSPQGSRAGVGFGNMLASTKKYFVQEHGWIMGLMSIIPAQNIYGDGYQRKFTRQTKFDYFFPEFQNLGEQDIKYQELFGYAVSGQQPMDGTFGYTPRYAEYQYHPGIVTGQMRTSMAYWHMARLFNSQPRLNETFVDSYTSLDDFDRLFPTDESLGDRFVVNLYHFERMKRPMQKNPIPSL